MNFRAFFGTQISSKSLALACISGTSTNEDEESIEEENPGEEVDDSVDENFFGLGFHANAIFPLIGQIRLCESCN